VNRRNIAPPDRDLTSRKSASCFAAIRKGIETQLRHRISADIKTAELPKPADAEALAAYVMAVIQGMSTLARDGAPRKKPMRIASTAMAAWPAPG
jgi:hypothetical protein